MAARQTPLFALAQVQQNGALVGCLHPKCLQHLSAAVSSLADRCAALPASPWPAYSTGRLAAAPEVRGRLWQPIAGAGSAANRLGARAASALPLLVLFACPWRLDL